MAHSESHLRHRVTLRGPLLCVQNYQDGGDTYRNLPARVQSYTRNLYLYLHLGLFEYFYGEALDFKILCPSLYRK